MTQDKDALPPDALLKRVSEFVTESRDMVKDGAMLEVEGLEAKVSELCEMVLSLSQDDRLRYADKLQILLSDIGKLGEEMKQLRDMMGGEIRSLTAVKKATVAYHVADASDQYGKKGNKDS